MPVFLFLTSLSILVQQGERECLFFNDGQGPVVGINNSDFDLGNIEATCVKFERDLGITSIEWTGVYRIPAPVNEPGAPPKVDDFVVEIRADDSGLPGELLQSNKVGGAVDRTDTGVDLFGGDLYSYMAELNFKVSQNQSIWFVVYNNTTGAEVGFFLGTTGAGNSANSSDLGVNWLEGISNIDLRIYSTDEVLLGDVNLDGDVNLLDVAPFVDRVMSGQYQVEANPNKDNFVNLLDVDLFVSLLVGE
ncbi:MAG: hypothetical protein AAGA30_02995 [Planctomycetota bacterium]